MVRLIMSGSGEGKTKQLIELMNSEAVSEVSFNLRHQTRMIDASEFSIGSFEALRGFLCGLYAGNYDISHIFIDNLCKVAHSTDDRQVGEFLNWLDGFSSPLNLKVTVTVSANPDTATDTMRKYM